MWHADCLPHVPVGKTAMVAMTSFGMQQHAERLHACISEAGICAVIQTLFCHVHDVHTTSASQCTTLYTEATCVVGSNGFRISLEWSRIMPEQGKIDQEAVDTYNKMFDCIEK